jgi:hypothetical protein
MREEKDALGISLNTQPFPSMIDLSTLIYRFTTCTLRLTVFDFIGGFFQS